MCWQTPKKFSAEKWEWQIPFGNPDKRNNQEKEISQKWIRQIHFPIIQQMNSELFSFVFRDLRKFLIG